MTLFNALLFSFKSGNIFKSGFYNKELNKTVWTKENMEENIIKMIGELDESC